jgi:hypothetical protein
MAAVGGSVFKPVGLRFERYLRHHMIIGDGEPIGRHQESRTGRCLPPGVGDQRANLQQPGWRRRIDGFGAREIPLGGPRRTAIDRGDRHKH